jgi:hypothetical protein
MAEEAVVGVKQKSRSISYILVQIHILVVRRANLKRIRNMENNLLGEPQSREPWHDSGACFRVNLKQYSIYVVPYNR